MNEFHLKIRDAAAIPEQLDSSKAIYLVAELDCDEVSKRDNHDGSFTLTYKTKIVGACEIRQGEKKQISKNKTKASQRLRWVLEDEAKEAGVDDLEAYYQSEMQKIISNRKEL